MPPSTGLEQIKNYFAYLFTEHNFEVIEDTYFQGYGMWVVLLRSDDCRLRFISDRGEVSLAAGPLWSPPGWQAGPWFSLPAIIHYLTQGRIKLAATSGSSDEQMKQLADQFRPYHRRTCELFRAGTFERHRLKLEAIRDRLEEEIWDELGGI